MKVHCFAAVKIFCAITTLAPIAGAAERTPTTEKFYTHEVRKNEIDRQFNSGEMNATWIAQVYLKKAEFSSYRHPRPDLAIQSILTHEIGHFNGMAHNFAGSLAGTLSSPSESIMDYL